MIWNFLNTGGFSPLKGFMVRSDYESVLTGQAAEQCPLAGAHLPGCIRTCGQKS
ncbi:MAG: hypothetical protein R2875_01640 [Desulfobacterales bacterium]